MPFLRIHMIKFLFELLNFREAKPKHTRVLQDNRIHFSEKNFIENLKVIERKFFGSFLGNLIYFLKMGDSHLRFQLSSLFCNFLII